MINFNESSIKKLHASAIIAFPHTKMRQHATDPIVIEAIHWTPFLGMKTLFVKSSVRNEDRHYNTVILFKNVDYNKKDVEIIANDGQKYKFGRLSLENTDVVLRCNCKDFGFRFNYYNHIDKSLYGAKRSQYENNGGPPANPMKLPGMCKHLMKTAYILEESGIF